MFPIVLVLVLIGVVAVIATMVRPALLIPLAVVTLIALMFAIVLALTLTGSTPVHIH
jgi:hypothetical protein